MVVIVFPRLMYAKSLKEWTHPQRKVRDSVVQARIGWRIWHAGGVHDGGDCLPTRRCTRNR